MVAVREIDEAIERHASRQGERAGKRHLAVQVDPQLASAAIKDARQCRLRSRRPKRQLNDSGRSGEGIALRRKADADVGPRLDALVADHDPAQIESVDPDVACHGRAETADFIRAVEADRLVTDAGSECVFGGGYRVLARSLGKRGHADTYGRKQ